MTQHIEQLNCVTLRALELITLGLGRSSDTFCPAQDGVRGAAFWWSVKAADWFIKDMQDDEVIDPDDDAGTCDFLLSLRECVHGYPALHVDIDFIHEDERSVIYAIMGKLACCGVRLAIMEKEEEEPLQEVMGAA